MARSTRTTTTLLFTDIEGSARQWEESPLMFDRVEQHFEVLRGAIDAAGGVVFATLGDGVAAAFASAGDGVGAAVAAQRDLEKLGLSVRMGLHTGEVERAGDDLRGRAVNRAARIMGVGHGGQVLLSDVTATLARSGSPSGARRPGSAPPPRPRRAGAALAGQPPRAAGDVPPAARPRQLHPQPPRPALVAGGPRPRARRARALCCRSVGS